MRDAIGERELRNDIWSSGRPGPTGSTPWLREMPVLPFDLVAARLPGTLAAMVRRSGRPRPRRTDLRIAATAGAHTIPLSTGNPADVTGLDRPVEVVAVRADALTTSDAAAPSRR